MIHELSESKLLFFQVNANNEQAKEKQKKYYKLKKTKGFKTYKFSIGQAVMKANPKKLGGRKGDRMTPDWLDGYVVVGLTDHQVVLRNTKTNKILKSISLAHIKPFRDRAVDSKVGGDVKGEKVEGFGGEDEDVGDKVKGFSDMSEDVHEESEDDGAGGEVAHDCGKVDCVKDTGGSKVVAEELINGRAFFKRLA